jgi:hypothetical protein
MTNQQVETELFETKDLDLALTRIGQGRPVRYIGQHQGVFRFESVKLKALMSLRGREGMNAASSFDLSRFVFEDRRRSGEAPPKR